jgi:hypothetical protein
MPPERTRPLYFEHGHRILAREIEGGTTGGEMKALMDFLNSNFGVLVSGAVISGLFVQYITSRWQQRNWTFQQQYTAEKAAFDKELEQKYKLLEDINVGVAAILAHSRFAVAAYVKSVPSKQLDQVMSSYNDAALKWTADIGLYSIRLRTLFHREPTIKSWSLIMARRDELDVAIYEFPGGSGKSVDVVLELLEAISDLTVALSRQMIDEIQLMKRRERAK